MTSKRQPNEAETTRERVSRLGMKVEVYLNYNLFRQARTAVEELLELAPDNVRGHEFRLAIAEAEGRSDEVLEELIKLAKLARDAEKLSVAGEHLLRARQRFDDDEIRAAAEKHDLELDSLLRIPGTQVIEPMPEQWPFVADDLCARSAVVQRLENPAELRVVAAEPEGDEEMESLAVALLRAAMKVPTGARRTVMFVDKTLSYVVFVSGQFAAVHEYTSTRLGRVVGRLHRLTFEAEHP